jgi:hypothetical protein
MKHGPIPVHIRSTFLFSIVIIISMINNTHRSAELCVPSRSVFCPRRALKDRSFCVWNESAGTSWFIGAHAITLAYCAVEAECVWRKFVCALKMKGSHSSCTMRRSDVRLELNAMRTVSSDLKLFSVRGYDVSHCVLWSVVSACSLTAHCVDLLLCRAQCQWDLVTTVTKLVIVGGHLSPADVCGLGLVACSDSIFKDLGTHLIPTAV